MRKNLTAFKIFFKNFQNKTFQIVVHNLLTSDVIRPVLRDCLEDVIERVASRADDRQILAFVLRRNLERLPPGSRHL